VERRREERRRERGEKRKEEKNMTWGSEKVEGKLIPLRSVRAQSV